MQVEQQVSVIHYRRYDEATSKAAVVVVHHPIRGVARGAIGKPWRTLKQKLCARLRKFQRVAVRQASAQLGHALHDRMHVRVQGSRHADSQARQATASTSNSQSGLASACAKISVDAGRASPRCLLRTGLYSFRSSGRTR